MSTPLPNFSQAHVLIAGDVMLDRYMQGAASRISPEAPVPVVHVQGTKEFPGGAGNVGLNVTALGAKAALCGLIGHDNHGEQLKQLLTLQGVEIFLTQLDSCKTITKLRVLSHHQQLIRLDFEESFLVSQSPDWLNDFKTQINHCGCVILSDYGKGTLGNPQDLIAIAKAANKPILIDPKGTDFHKYRGATLLSPNRKEFEAVVGLCPDDDALTAEGMQLIKDLDLFALLITRGPEGMTLLTRENSVVHLPASAREVYDVSGAGDTVIAVLGTAVACGQPLEEAVRFANAAAGIVVTKLGTATVRPDELLHALHPPHLSERGVATLDQLQKYLLMARGRGERIVMTNGCFDILHMGHVDYLARAKLLGDRLIVAVNSDDSVIRLKGPSRPILPLEQRMALLAALEVVDWVISFDSDTPEALIQAIHPDILVKGGDYQVHEIAGSEWLLNNGKEVRILPFVPGCSTSNIIKKIQTQMMETSEA